MHICVMYVCICRSLMAWISGRCWNFYWSRFVYRVEDTRYTSVASVFLFYWNNYEYLSPDMLIISWLILQEHLQALAHESLQADRDRLEMETRRLQREIEEWKQLVHSSHRISPDAPPSPGLGRLLSPSASSPGLQQSQAATIAGLQRENLQLQSSVAQLEGLASDLQAGRDQDRVKELTHC